MSTYRGTAGRSDRAKAITAVIAVHVALALVILTGLNVRMVSRTVERLTTIAIREPPPPPPVTPPAKPAPKPQTMKQPTGAPAKKAEPTPIVAPLAKLPVPSPIPAARVAGTGSASISGAATAGSGTGAGSGGSGPGGGGYGDYSRFTPARLASNIPNAEYGRLASTGIPSGLVGVVILVNRDGSVSNCRVARSSGDPSIDSLVCQLTLRYVRFTPARDPSLIIRTGVAVSDCRPEHSWTNWPRRWRRARRYAQRRGHRHRHNKRLTLLRAARSDR
jgi:protein TonB